VPAHPAEQIRRESFVGWIQRVAVEAAAGGLMKALIDVARALEDLREHPPVPFKGPSPPQASVIAEDVHGEGVVLAGHQGEA
jgi:hypothetical protein